MSGACAPRDDIWCHEQPLVAGVVIRMSTRVLESPRTRELTGPRSSLALPLRTPVFLVHVDVGHAGDLAWREAIRRARLDGAMLVALRVIRHGAGEGRADALAELAARVDALDGVVHATVAVVRGEPGIEIVRAAAHVGAELIIAGHDVGELAIDVLVQRVRCPVLFVREPTESGTVVGGTDLSDPSLPVVAATCAEVKSRSRGLAFVAHALEPISAMNRCLRIPALAQEVLRDATAVADTRIRSTIRRFPEAQPVVVDGPPGLALVEFAANVEADLLVVGTIGRTGIRRWFLGNVAEYVVRWARCSVLVVRLDRTHRARD